MLQIKKMYINKTTKVYDTFLNNKDDYKLTSNRREWDSVSELAEPITFDRVAHASKCPFIICRSKLGSCTSATDIFSTI